MPIPIYTGFVVLIDVPAFMMTNGTLAAVASGAIDKALGVNAAPVRTCA